MIEPVTSEKQITSEWLASRLRQNGHLATGAVVVVSISHSTTLFSDIYRLEVAYSADAHPTLPTKLLLKVPFPPDVSGEMGKDEVNAYSVLTSTMDDPPIVRRLDAEYSPASQRSHLLLEDLSDTHFQPELPVPPSQRHCELSVKSLAQLHAFWWEHPGLGSTIGRFFDEEFLRDLTVKTQAAMSGFLDYLGDNLSDERRRGVERALRFLPEFWKSRLTSRTRNTLIHGDAHVWNMLHPKDCESGRTYLIDLGTTNRIRPATNDLAYMMALQWYPERRKRMEEALLKTYHLELEERGVKHYAWDDCLLDYRYSVITHLSTPVLQWAGGQIPATVWWNNLERISEAYKDLNCDELV